MFRAHDPERDRPVAVKLFTLDLAPERVHQLVSEFEWLIAATLDHPALSAPIATGIVEASAYLVQDFVDAQSLDLAVREFGPAPGAHAVRVAAQLAGALDFAAAVNVTHGALHPRDVLLSAADMRITGIGISRALEAVGVTPPVRRPYTAPERLENGQWDRRADVFSLAALVHEVLWGRRIGLSGNEVTTTISPTAGGDLAALRAAFARALAVDPAARFATALEFADALSQAFPDLAGQDTDITPASQDTVIAARSPQITDVSFAEEKRPARSSTPTPAPRLPLDEDERRDGIATETAVKGADATDVRSADVIASDLNTADPNATDPNATIVKAMSTETMLHTEAPDVDEEQTLVGVHPDFSGRRGTSKIEAPDARANVEARDLPLKSAEEPPHQYVEAAPAFVSTEDTHPAAPRFRERAAPFAVEERHQRSMLGPVTAALAMGIGLGFLGGYNVGSKGPSKEAGPGAPVAAATPAAPARPASASGREFTENTVTSPQSTATQTPPVLRPPAASSGSPASTSDRQAAAKGRLLVRSTPTGARVVVDGRDAGVTPIAVRDLANGAHLVRVTEDGYVPAERRVVITAARPAQSLTVPLDRNRTSAPAPAPPSASDASQRFVGTLFVDSRPSGARVYIDGKLAGNTPLSMRDLRAGEHAIRLEHDGYRRWSSSVRIVAAERNRVTASLEER